MEGNYLDTQGNLQSNSEGESGAARAEQNLAGADNQATVSSKRNIMQETHVRPIIAIISIVALCYFYTLAATGTGDPPAEINTLWIPVLWFFRDRTLIHKKQGEL